MKALITMRRAIEDPDLFGAIFAGESWRPWRVLLIAALGEFLADEERAVFRELTGRACEAGVRAEEFWAICGRRAGKTRAIAILAAYIASLCDFSDVLAPGERASLPIMSASTWQAGKCFQYLDGIFSTVPSLKQLVTNQTADTISLSTRVDIEVRPASFRTARGGTCVAAICDEIAFWRSDTSANPDVEILNAIRPALATTGGMLACISSPYARRGELYNTWKRDFGPSGDPAVLVAKAASRTMNPSLSAKVVQRAYERDSASAAAEYGAEFRVDVESFISREVVEAAVIPDRHELPRIAGIHYIGFCDPSGGSADDMTLAIAHREKNVIIVDCIRAVKPPFSPDAVVGEFSALLKSYGIREVVGDRYGGEWPRERFRANGITYKPSEKTKSDLYREALPLLNAGRVELLDHSKLISQLCSLERRVARSGRDSIDHPPGQHDDAANAFAGVLVSALGGARLIEFSEAAIRALEMGIDDPFYFQRSQI